MPAGLFTHPRRLARTRLALVGALALVPALAAGVAFATGLTIVPRGLTVFEAASTVPVTTCTLAQAAADATVDGAPLNADRNYGSLTTLTVRSSATGDARTLIRFDLSSCSIPQTAVIESASLRLHLQSAPESTRTYAAHRLTAGWNEIDPSGVTWNNQPGAIAVATDTVATGTRNGVSLQWDVAADVQAFVNLTAANRGWRLNDAAEGAPLGPRGTLTARESATAAQRPQLDITYRP